MSNRPTKTAVAMAAGKLLTDALHDRNARSVEQVVDRKFGVIFERWLLPNGTGVVSMLAPEFREVFVEATPRTNSWDATFEAIDVAAGLKKPPAMAHLIAVLESFRTCIGPEAFAEFVAGNEAVSAAAKFLKPLGVNL